MVGMGSKVKKSDVLELLKEAEAEGVRLPSDDAGRLVAGARHLKENGGDRKKAVEALGRQFGVKEKEEERRKKEESVIDLDGEGSGGGEEEKEEEEEGEPKKKKRKTRTETKLDVKCEANEGLVAAFKELSKYEFEEGQKFKGAAYVKVANALAALEDKVESGKACLELKGVGKASAKKIDQFLETGKIDRLEEARMSRE